MISSSYLTFEQLYKPENRYELYNRLNDYGIFEPYSRKTMVFLSHRHSEDENLIKQVRGFFASMGAVLYIDWMDENMPEVTSSETAAKLKSQIARSQKFVVLATPQSIESIWIPWEIGLADQLKGLENIAILPVIHEDDTWSSREYYQLYSRIERVGSQWLVLAPGHNQYGTNLKDWLLQ